MNDKNSLFERHHHAIEPWNLTEMSHEMRCHLHKTWQDIENHEQLEWFCAAEEPEHVDHEEIDSCCYSHRPTFRKESWQTEPPKQMQRASHPSDRAARRDGSLQSTFLNCGAWWKSGNL